ncbi:cysteine desulfurase [Paenibacillus taihuensis]|uniref:cysteine desulfurase n=1 Tax=Paenibacillus taihuensis TaxID=1156355 RepID=A0A3D9RWJ7_9BACL|nr:cysteine desulfurase family protein [Paenibacillus taihuensis]REE84350.1 cysteine desulfurase [Paenibacillus taihuensis]
MERIYYDHAASTPVHPEVVSEMMSVYTSSFGNPSSTHAYGRGVRQLLNRARDIVASGIGAAAAEIVFTGGGTEGDNMALIGAARAARKQHGKSHIITSATEHHAILHASDALEEEGFRVTVLPVDEQGLISMEELADAIEADTAVISIMYVNNETGTIQPIEEIGELARSRGVLFHVDAVQALGAISIDLKQLPVDLMSFSAHKINGPQGVGALFVRKGVSLEEFSHGGSQERGRRAGTENVAGIVGFAKAVELSVKTMEERKLLLGELRHTWIERMNETVGADRIAINGHETMHVPHILNMSFIGISAESMLMNLDLAGVAASGGSACTSGAIEPSYVLRAMGVSIERQASAVRFSFGLGNTMEELEQAAKKVATFIGRVRTNA